MSKFQGVLKMFMLGMLKTILKTVLKYEKNTISLYGTCWNWAADFVFLLRFCTRKRSETYYYNNFWPKMRTFYKCSNLYWVDCSNMFTVHFFEVFLHRAKVKATRIVLVMALTPRNEISINRHLLVTFMIVVWDNKHHKISRNLILKRLC